MTTLTLTTETIRAARIALLGEADTHANDALRYIELGWDVCASHAAMLAIRHARAWHELAFAVSSATN